VTHSNEGPLVTLSSLFQIEDSTKSIAHCVENAQVRNTDSTQVQGISS
jgi:hypothetical protein